MTDDGASHVRGGEFRVDRGRMKEKLARFQLKGRGEFLLAWVRAAVAAGAGRIEVRWFWEGGFEVAFDGRTFSRDELEDLYAPLLSLEPDPRRYYLAVGVLGALGQGAKSVGVGSGIGRKCPLVIATSLTDEKHEQTSIPDGGTAITVLGVELSASSARALLAGRCADCTVPIWVDGDALTERAEREEGGRVLLEREGARVSLEPALTGEAKSRIGISVCGVAADSIEVDLGAVIASGTLADDRLALDASQAKVVHSLRLERDQALVREAGKALFDKLLEGHRRRLREAGKLLVRHPPLLAAWAKALDPKGSGATAVATGVARLAGALARLTGLTGTAEGGWEPQVVEAGRRTAWLRETALRGTQDWEKRRGSTHERFRPFWVAPVFLDWRARPLSLLELREGCEGTGILWYSTRPHAGPPSGEPVVWITSSADMAALRRAFPSVQLKDQTWKAENDRTG